MKGAHESRRRWSGVRGADSREWGSLVDSLWSVNETHMLCCSPTSYDSNSHRSRDLDVYVSKLNTSNTSVQTAVSPKQCRFQSVYRSKGDSQRQSYDFKQTTTSIVISWWITVKPNRLVSRRDTSWSMLLIVRLFLIKNQTDPSGKMNRMRARADASLGAHQITIDFEGCITASGITESSCSTTNNTFWEAWKKKWNSVYKTVWQVLNMQWMEWHCCGYFSHSRHRPSHTCAHKEKTTVNKEAPGPSAHSSQAQHCSFTLCDQQLCVEEDGFTPVSPNQAPNSGL